MTFDHDIVSALEERRDGIRSWIEEAAAFTALEQGHLVESSAERAYWHHGYQAALDDVIRSLTATDRASRTAGRTN